MKRNGDPFYVLLMESSTTVSAGRSGSGGAAPSGGVSPGCWWVADDASMVPVRIGAGSPRGAWRRSQQSLAASSVPSAGPA